jgi:hypothetical protein
MRLDHKPSRRYAEYVRRIVCDEWTPAGSTGGDKALLVHVSGVTVAYCLHDGGNDWNGPRNFALEVQKTCGCQLIEARGRKKSRKAVKPSGFDPARVIPSSERERIESLRARHAEQRVEWEALVANPTRDGAQRARELLAEIRQVEDELTCLYQPVDRIAS